MSLNPIDIAQRLIRCPSVTPEDAGALAAVEALLTPLGFRCQRFRFEAEGTAPVENLYARLGTTGPNFCFAGHTDVVPIGDSAAWTADPFGGEIRDGYLYGRGAEDMKGAIAAFIAAASRIAPHLEHQGSISLLLTGDEEGPAINGTVKLLKAITEQGETLDACLVGEPTNPTYLGEMAKIGRRGSITFELTVNGTQGHIAYPQLADNPTTRLVRILERLKRTPLDEGTEHFQPSNLEITTIDVNNPADNVIPAHAFARFNIRFNDRHSADSLKAWVEMISREEAPEHTLKSRSSANAFLTPPGRLSELVSEAIQSVTGHTPQLSTTGGTSDARFIKDYCPVIEFGTTGLTPHKINERVKTDDLSILTDVYEQVLRRFLSL